MYKTSSTSSNSSSKSRILAQANFDSSWIGARPDGHQFIVPEVHGLPDMEHVHTQYGAPPTVKQPDPEQSPDNKKSSPAEQPEDVGIKS